MVDLEALLTYVPKQHGEHGVDATLHMLAKRQSRLHEVFSNPPGASWTQFDILKPGTSEMYRWDHMPRVPQAKRPDFVLQFNQVTEMNFLLIESKQSAADVYPKMGTLLTQFLTGSRGYLGLKNRPAWHRRKLDQKYWEVIEPTSNEDVRFWFRNYPEQRVHYWTGFAFSLEPEYIERTDAFNRTRTQTQLEGLLRSNRTLHVAIAVGWSGRYHEPFAVRVCSEEFGDTVFRDEFDRLLNPVLIE
jgi:hypothetical protein